MCLSTPNEQISFEVHSPVKNANSAHWREVNTEDAHMNTQKSTQWNEVNESKTNFAPKQSEITQEKREREKTSYDQFSADKCIPEFDELPPRTFSVALMIS